MNVTNINFYDRFHFTFVDAKVIFQIMSVSLHKNSKHFNGQWWLTVDMFYPVTVCNFIKIMSNMYLVGLTLI